MMVVLSNLKVQPEDRKESGNVLDDGRMNILKVDYHNHLEEGPYSSNWLKKTFDNMSALVGSDETPQTLKWMQDITSKVDKRVQHGGFTSEWLDFYLIQAKRLNLSEVGIVDHLYRFEDYKTYYEKHMYLENDELGNMQREWLDKVAGHSIEAFVALIEQEKEKWEKAGVQLRLGIEADYFPGCEDELGQILKEYPYDYIIGSVHFINGWGFDNPETKHLYLEHDLNDLYKLFFDYVEDSISTGLFDIIAHLDNLKVFEFRPDENELLPHYNRIADKLIEMDVATEINAGLYYRYPIEEMCPSPTFLKVLARKNVKITTSSDAHFPVDLGNYISSQVEELSKSGFTKICTFKQRERTEFDINLS